jgi:proline iminopeptidase
MVMWGIFTGRQKEIDWLYKQGASFIRPEAFEEYLNCILLGSYRENPLDSYYSMLTSEDYEVRLKAARAFSKWEASCSKIEPS